MASRLGAALRERVNGLPVWAWCLGLALLFAGAALVGGLQEGPRPADEAAPGSGATASTWLALGVFLKLSLVVGAAYLGLVFLRRWQGSALGSARRHLTVLESVHLSPRQALHLVRAGKKTLLVGGTDHALTLLGEVELEPQVESAEEQAGRRESPLASGATFANLLARHFTGR